MSDWVPIPKPVPPELSPEFEHAYFPPKRVEWCSFAEKLSTADAATLHLLMNGGAGEIS